MLRHVDMEAEKVHRYGNILGLPALRAKISSRLEQLGLDMSDMEIVITAGISWLLLSNSAIKVCYNKGANQPYQSTALALSDNGDEAVILAPYYFSHKVCNVND
jgi:aspartate/methionine/tyrosine aminotransferase